MATSMSTNHDGAVIPGIDREALAEAILRETFLSDWIARRIADSAIAYIATHQEPRACCACGAKYDKCPECAADGAYEKGRKDAACDDDEWVEVRMDDIRSLPMSVRTRQEWEKRFDGKSRFFVHRDDLPDDPRALIARELGPGKADTFLGLLDEHGWAVTRKGER